MTFKTSFILPLALCLACPAFAEGPSRNIATVNGEAVLRAEYDKNLKDVMGQYSKNIPGLATNEEAKKDIEKGVLNRMIDDVLVIQAAENAKIKIRPRELDAGVQEVKARFMTDETGADVPEAQGEVEFKKELAKEGLTLDQFKERIRKQLMARKYIEETIKPK
ncbi:MAG: SurA N-terminal domain-containing protein, partial [Elusimicrobiaceae bacterium]